VNMTDNPTETRSGTEPIQKRKQHSGHGERGKGRGGSDRKSTSNNSKNPQGDENKRRNQNQKNKSSKKSDASAVEQARVDEAPKLTEEDLLLKAEQDALAAKEAEDTKIRAKLLADKETLEHSLSSKIANIQEFVSKIEIHKGYRYEVSAEALKSSRLKFAGNKTKLKSDLKKCTAFIRKVKSAPAFDALTVKSLINDLDTLNLTRYLEEIAQGLVENKSRKVSDVMGLTQLCHALHVRYDNWMDEFTPRVLSVLKDKNSDPKHRRIIVRVMVEMVLFGIGETKPVLKVLADAAGSPGTNGGENYEVADANMIISIVKSGGYELIGIVPNTILKDVENLENVTISYQNNLHDSNLCTESDHGTDIDTSKTIHVPLSPSQKVLDEAIEAVRRFRDIKESLAVPSEVCERFQKHLNGAFLFLSNLLVSTHKRLSKMKKRCAQDRLLAGTLPEQREKALEDAIQLMDSMFKSVEVLADSLNKSIPELVEEVDEVKEDTTKLEVYKGDDGQTDLGPFDDEDAKDFYCNIPDLLSTIPPVLLGYKEEEVEKLKDLNKTKYSFESDDAGEHRDLTDEAKVREDTIIDVIHESEDHFDVSAEGKAEEDEEVKDTPHFKLLAMIEEELPECNRRDKVDALAEKFCTTHGAANKSRKRLEKAIFLVPRSRLDLIPYYSRLSAILDRVFPDITSALVSELEQQFHGLAKWKKQSSLESRVRNARFIGELTKFRVAAPIVALRCFARCLDDFSGYNVDIACCLLESCGRFLFKTKHTSTKIAKIMDTMDRIRKAKVSLKNVLFF
jgi:regulator of nonsense transcripts 2